MDVTERDALTVAGLRKTFEAENAPVRALRGIDLAVRAGEFVAMMGPSGRGKSTLLNLAAVLDVPDEGTITVAGETVTGRTEDDLARLRRKHMGIVFQFFNLLEGMTVLENVVLPSVIAGRRRKMAETRARDLLDQLADEVKATIQELRDLAHGIYTPLLADSGLAEALRATGRRSPLPVAVTAAGIGRYGLDVETAVYFCCLEALQNAVRHAAGASVAVRLWEESGGLLFSVADDGPGFDAALARGGHGYTNMADRLGAIGGTVRWDSVSGAGTTISGSVPLL